MEQLKRLLLFSSVIMLGLMMYIYVRNYEQYGYIVLFHQIPLYKHLRHFDNLWLTGMFSFYALVNVSVFVGYFLYHYIIYKNIYCFKFKYNPKFRIIPTAITIWIWLSSFILLFEIALYGPGNKFRSMLGININYFNDQFTNQLVFSNKDHVWILLVIISAILIFIKYGYFKIKQYIIEYQKEKKSE